MRRRVWNRIFGVIVSVCMVASLTACGSTAKASAVGTIPEEKAAVEEEASVAGSSSSVDDSDLKTKYADLKGNAEFTGFSLIDPAEFNK